MYTYTEKIPESDFYIKYFYTYYFQHKQKGHIFAGQRHNFWEINIPLKGELILTCENKIINLKKGQMYIIPPNQFHRVNVIEDIDMLIITFSADLDVPDLIFNLTDGDMQIAKLLISEMQSLYPNNDFNSQKTAPQSLKAFTEILIKHAITGGRGDYVKNESSGIYEKIITFMNANLFNKITADEIADYCHLSYSTIKNIFKQHAGCGVMQYFNGLKIECSKGLLMENMSVNQIAEELNYASPGHFSSAFKKSQGVSPLAYKKDMADSNL